MVDTEVEILQATRRALVDHGYHGLTTQKVADELGRSHSLVHYHFDTKADLLVAFVEFHAEQFEHLLGTIEDHGPGERLARFLALLAGNAEVPQVRSLNLALYELQATAHDDPALGAAFAAYHELLLEFVAGTIEEGVESGTFADDDPRRTAELLVSAVDGAFLQQYTLDVDTVERVAFDGLVTYVLEDLYLDEVPDLDPLADELDATELSDRVASNLSGEGS
jgi:AcrR family transcriptional regulator